ncbi:hypothetical protein [uncultured Sphingomonas sp.]|uniref:hypothetical protein n=1 Tax=uncultured Sphingomonas sp. TaxID=158754 RepID=UPI0026373B9B|nr:hypothetical protein [uncultured Sphingomonas sp.]
MITSEYALIERAVDFTMQHADEAEARAVENLQTGAANRDINALRMVSMQRSIVAIGAIQAFEGVLQQHKGWGDTFGKLDRHLRATGYDELADRFVDYRDAINVLKHGHGRSYERLLAKRAALPFTVKDRGQPFFDEGDVSEGLRLVDANRDFVCQCSAIIKEIAAVL